MKKKHTLIIISVLVVGIFSTAAVLADSHRKDYRRNFGFKQHHKGGGLQLLARYQQKNLGIQVLSEMVGQSNEAIRLKLEDQRMRSLMRELNVDREAFRAALRTKVREQISQAASAGSITEAQEKEIIEKLESRAKRGELMSRLIEKGLEDGTITAAEARMLMPKRR